MYEVKSWYHTELVSTNRRRCDNIMDAWGMVWTAPKRDLLRLEIWEVLNNTPTILLMVYDLRGVVERGAAA